MRKLLFIASAGIVIPDNGIVQGTTFLVNNLTLDCMWAMGYIADFDNSKNLKTVKLIEQCESAIPVLLESMKS